ncbi:MAG: NAD(+)/NADH kinase [Sandaracinaceae bacterium]
MRSGAKRDKRPRVLVIYKKSAYQIYVRERKNQHIQKLVEEGDPTVRNILAADAAHVETIDEVKRAGKALGVRMSLRYRSDEVHVEDYELIVTVGGDGTLLWASHRVPPGLPVLAINSAPHHSVGHFCGGRKGEVQANIAAALAGELEATRLTRMQVRIDGEVVHRRVLNDALFCHKSPAATTRYLMNVNGEEEAQKSSGIWIGPSAGSTAAQRSAGGRILPPGSRKIQFVVREPYNPPEGPYRFRRGTLAPGEVLRLASQVREGRVFLDGPHVVHEVSVGSLLEMERSEESLTLLAFPRASG